MRTDTKVLKAEMRRRMKALAAELPPREKMAQGKAVAGHIGRSEVFRAARTVGLYHALGDELPTAPILELWSGQKKLLLPVVEGDLLKFCLYDGEIAPGAFGIGEPVGRSIDPSQIDIILVPGVAFDTGGYRLGRGKGFYDRFLAQCNAYTIGVCMDHQVVAAVPREAHDIKLHAVVAPSFTFNI